MMLYPKEIITRENLLVSGFLAKILQSKCTKIGISIPRAGRFSNLSEKKSLNLTHHNRKSIVDNFPQ